MKHRNALKKKYFRHEMRVCAGCHRKRPITTNNAARWQVVGLTNGHAYYLCPQCFADWISPTHNRFG